MTPYDLIIVGAGPAGITASVYAARKRMNFLVISRNLGGKTRWISEVGNYTSYQFITGPELAQKFKEHLEHVNVAPKEHEVVTLVEKDGYLITVKTNKGSYKSRTAIIATGRIPKKPSVNGEAKFRNKGVTYCATCDAPLFADMDVAVIGGGNDGLGSVLQLVKIARKIYLIEMDSQLSADPILVEKAKQSGKVTVHTNTKAEEVYGDKFVKGIKICCGDTREDLPVEGVFIEVRSVPVSEFAEGVAKNDKGEIIVNSTCETDVPGIFAAGDVTNVYGKQIIVACGEGAKASMAAFDYLSRMK